MTAIQLNFLLYALNTTSLSVSYYNFRQYILIVYFDIVDINIFFCKPNKSSTKLTEDKIKKKAYNLEQ